MASPIFRYLPVGLAALSFAFAVTILGTAAHTMSVYNIQSGVNPWWIPLWAEHFDVRGTRSLIGSAAVVLILNLFFCVVNFVPRFELPSRPHFRAALGVGAAVPSALLTMSTTIYAHILNANSPQRDTIQTWTCHYRAGGGVLPEAVLDGYPLPSEEGNALFGQLCNESKFALYGTLTIFFLQLGLMGAAVVSWLLELWQRRKNSSGKSEESGEWENVHVEMKNGN